MSFQDNSNPTEILQILQGHVTMCHTLSHLVENNQAADIQMCHKLLKNTEAHIPVEDHVEENEAYNTDT
jgi:hypothetical protein